MRRILIAAFVLAILPAGAAQALDIPLTVPERAGMDRVDNHVYGGIPLPEGAYKDAEKFWLLDEVGQPVSAQFVVRERWLKDDSVRFMTVHFTTNLKASQTGKFTVVDQPRAETRTSRGLAPVTVKEEADAVVVDTAAVKFTVKKGDWHLFDAVDAGGKPALAKPGKVIFKAEYGQTPVANDMATPPPLGEFAEATAVLKSIAVEEKGPGRAVVLVKGEFQQAGVNKLDFQARYYATAGSPAVRVVFTVINRQGKAWDQFVGLRALGFELPLALEGEKKFAIGASEGNDVEGTLRAAPVAPAADQVRLLQPTSLEYVISDKAQARGKCRELLTKRVGWLSLAGKDRAVTAAVRWFWQLHPKGLEAAGDGTLKVWLVPFQDKKVEVPVEQATEPLVRVDLYTGGAKTHEMLFAFHPAAGAADARARAAGVIEPLFAACTPEWYCQKTWAFDRIYDARLENYRPELRDLITRYENSVDRSFGLVMTRMDGHEPGAAEPQPKAEKPGGGGSEEKRNMPYRFVSLPGLPQNPIESKTAGFNWILPPPPGFSAACRIFAPCKDSRG